MRNCGVVSESRASLKKLLAVNLRTSAKDNASVQVTGKPEFAGAFLSFYFTREEQ